MSEMGENSARSTAMAWRTVPCVQGWPRSAASVLTARTGVAATPPAPMLIYTAAVDLSVRRAEITATLDRVVDLAYAMGGYLVQRTDAQVQVRVPSGFVARKVHWLTPRVPSSDRKWL